MHRGFSVFAMTAVLVQMPGPAGAADRCAAGYKDFIVTVSPYIDRVEDAELPSLMRRGIGILDACNAGDKYAPGASWRDLSEQIARPLTQEQSTR